MPYTKLEIRRAYTAMTAQRATRLGLNPSRQYGYVVRVSPPIIHETLGEDLEGIGWVPHWGGPRKHAQNFSGWYKYKADAVARAHQLNHQSK